MMLPRRIHYALQALKHLARHGQTFQPAHSIASHEGLPVRFLDLILAELRDAGLLESLRGMNGGYRLVTDPSAITLVDILGAMRVSLAPVACVEPGGQRCAGCGAQACTLKAVFEDAYRAYRQKLAGISLADMVQSDAPAVTSG